MCPGTRHQAGEPSCGKQDSARLKVNKQKKNPKKQKCCTAADQHRLGACGEGVAHSASPSAAQRAPEVHSRALAARGRRSCGSCLRAADSSLMGRANLPCFLFPPIHCNQGHVCLPLVLKKPFCLNFFAFVLSLQRIKQFLIISVRSLG